MCKNHWQKLKQSIKARGLGDFVATNQEDAEKKFGTILAGQETFDTFEPLMVACMCIMANAVEQGGIYLMMEKEDGTHYCPLCEAENNGATDWIERATDDVAKRAEELRALKEATDAMQSD